MPRDRTNQPDLDLSPQLDYATPDGGHRWMDMFQDVIDLLGGWLGIAFLVGLYAILLAPFAPGWLAGVFILAGMVILQITVVYWLKKE